MSTQDDKKDVQGRSWDQITKNGTSSAGSMGVGGTGDSGKLQGDGSQQSARTDDLLDDGTEMGDKGFSSGGGQVQTGLEGIGKLTGGAKGNRQAGQQGGQRQQGSQGSQGSRASDDARDDDTQSEFSQDGQSQQGAQGSRASDEGRGDDTESEFRQDR